MEALAIAVFISSEGFWLLILLTRVWFSQVDGKAFVALVNVLLRLASIAIATLWCIGIAFRTASSLCRERDRRTLSMLLSLPVERSALLRARWLGGILRFRTFGFFLVGIWSLGLVTGTLHPFGVLLLAGSCAAFVALLASMGVWLALVCRDTMRAQLSMALMLLVLFVGPWLYLMNLGDPSQFSSDPAEKVVHLWEVGLNPVAAWWVAGFSSPEWRDALIRQDRLFAARLHAVVYGIAGLAALAGLVWYAARRRLEMEPRD
jgi:hypothetical protein